MGVNGTDVTTQTSSVTASSTAYGSLSTAQAETQSHLAQVDNDLYNRWEGIAGDNFRLASYTIESLLTALSHRNDNTSQALDQCKLKFDELDAALENNLAVDYGGLSYEGDN